MAPVNGIAGKPAKPAARPAIVPVLPLNYPQRPVNKQPSVPTATSSSPNKAQNGVRPAEEKTGSHVPKQGQEQLNGNSAAHGPSSAHDLNTETPSAAPAQTGAKAEPAEPAGPVPAPDEGDKGMLAPALILCWNPACLLPSPRPFSPPSAFRYPAPGPAPTLAGENLN
jgi:hypothetical protein